MFDERLKKKIEKRKIVAVIVIESAENAVPTAKALMDGGIDIIELAFRTPDRKISRGRR